MVYKKKIYNRKLYYILHSLPLGSLLLVVSSGVAMAQNIVPGAAQPGQIEQPFRRELVPRPSTSVDVPIGPQQVLPDEAKKVTFTVSRITLEGGSQLQSSLAEPLLQSFANRETNLAEIYGLAEKLTAQYRNEGLVLSRVLVPEQRIVGGEVRLRAVEGYINNVIFEGATKQQLVMLESYADKIKSSRPLRAEVLERYLLLMNDLSGSYAQAILQASSTGTGAADLVIRFSSRQADGNVELNRRGSRALGPINFLGSVAWHSPLGLFDELQATLATTPNDELYFISLGYDVPVGFDGLILGGSLSLAKAHPDVGDLFDVQTRSASGDLHASYPVIRSRKQNLYIRAGLAWLNGRTEVNGLQLSNDHVRSLNLGVTYDVTDRWLGVNMFSLGIVQGLDIAGATKEGSTDASRTGASPSFTKTTFSAARLQSLAPRVDLLAALSGQYSGSRLFPSEQFGFGGPTYGRAYDASELLGDSGAALKFELRYAGAALGTFVRAYTVYGFYEIGKVWRRDPINQRGIESAADAGAGLRFNLIENLSGYIELTKPLTHDTIDKKNRGVRAFGAVRWTF